MKTLIKNTRILVRENGKYCIKNGNIAVEDAVISSVGEVDANARFDKVIDGTDKLATPALINCHTHAYMSVFRNLADDLTFGDWLFGAIMPREDRMTKPQAKIGALLSIIEMMKSGTGTYLDMHMFSGTSCKAALESGMRAVLSRGLAGELGDADKGAERRIREATEEIAEFSGHDTLSFMLAPHAIYTNGEKFLRYTAELAKEKGLGINMHLSETETEFADCMKAHKMTPVAYCDSLGLLTDTTVAAHCVKVTDDDIGILAQRGVSVASCPISNMKLANGFAPIKKLMASGVNIVLGTDSCASNNTVNLFPDMRAYALVHKGNLQDALAIGAADVIDAVTRNAAKALRLANGAIEAGKLADIALFDLDVPTFRPNNNLVSALAYSANGSEVSELMINGKLVLEKGEILTVDCEKVYYEAEKIIASL